MLRRDTITPDKLAQVMKTQFLVWKGTPNANNILADTCYALAKLQNLNSVGKAIFLQDCGVPIVAVEYK